MKILHLISSLDPDGGGPIEGVRQISSRVRARGHEVEILSMDSPDCGFIKDFPLRVHALGPSILKYGYNRRVIPWLRENAKNYDVVVVNGIWQFHSFAAWRALAGEATPYFVFTHGMLDPWFKRAYPLKHLKKWLYWPWGEYRVLRDARAVLFTCEEERLLARESFWLYRCNEVVTAYGTAKPPADRSESSNVFLKRHLELSGKRLVLFLGRIHEKKGCDILIEAFAAAARLDSRLHLIMAGPDQTGLAAKLQQLANELNLADRISWVGMLSGDMKWGAFHASEVFALPSHQENFGIAVAEALACGKPVMISNKVNIWREIEADGAGWIAEDTLDGTIANFERWLAQSPEELEQKSKAAMKCFSERFHIDRVADRFLEILGGSS
jgi:glycosyltransferase involved in cell wall biosynthesis